MNKFISRSFSAFITLTSLVSVVFAALVPDWRQQFSGSGYGYYTYEAPMTVAASDGIYPDKVEVYWSGVWGAISYAVYRCTDMTTDSCGDPIGSTTVAPFNDTGAIPGVPYYYRVKAVSSVTYGEFSGFDSGHSAADLTGIKPSVQASDDNKDKIVVTWNSIDVTASYDVFRADTGIVDDAVLIANGVADTFYDDDSASPGVIYVYWVKAENLVSESDLSEGATGIRVRDLALGSAPQYIKASDGEFPGKVVVSWESLVDATEYKIFRSVTSDPNSALELAIVDEPKLSYDDVAAVPGTVYNYWVKGSNVGSESAFSSSDDGFIEGCDFYVIKAKNGNVISFCL